MGARASFVPFGIPVRLTPFRHTTIRSEIKERGQKGQEGVRLGWKTDRD